MSAGAGSRSPEALLAGLERMGTRLGLGATRGLLEALGHPERRYPVVLVAGTNGKGSTAALLAAMATASGRRTGLYTSPHLESVTERLRLDGGAISERELRERLERVLAAAPPAASVDERPTYFEALTVAAMLWFADRGAELAVLEVGLGGRLDATNAAEPVLSLVSEIGLDHQEHLGESLAEIALEKAGVLRRGRPAIASVGEREAWDALRGAAAARGARLRAAPELAAARPLSAFALDGTEVEVRTERRVYRSRLALPGPHQLANLELATAAAEALAELGLLELEPDAVERGIAGCRWPGRLERVTVGATEVVLDGAHNRAGAAALARYLAGTERPWDLLFGVLAGKEGDRMLASLAAGAERVTLTAPPSPRAVRPETLRPAAGARARVIADPAAALAAALADEPERLVVCGSLYLVGAARQRLRELHGVPPPAAALATFVEPPAPSGGRPESDQASS